MSAGSKAWESVGFLVFGEEPLFPAKMEQYLAGAMRIVRLLQKKESR